MPAVSKKQQKFFGIVRAIQKGEMAPTTPETAKAAADMKKGDVKKFASTKHKGLPEKKKIVEDKQVKKIIKQLRKSVKSHKKQADTLEKKIKTFKESAFSNITVGNKVAQTFQHATGATITLDGALGGKMMVPSQVTLDLGFGEKITVDGPTESEFGLAGYTKPLDSKLQKRIADQSVDEINDKLDASQEASGAETAKVSDIPSETTFPDTMPSMAEMEASYEDYRKNNPDFPPFSELASDLELPDIPEEGWTYDEYVAMMNALAEAAAKRAEPIEKEIRAYGPTGTKIYLDRFGQRNTPIGLIDANSAIIEALSKAQEALYQKWLAYNKMPDLPSGSPEDADPKLDPTQKFGMRDLGSGPAMTDLGVERKSPSGTFDKDGNYIPPGFEDAIRTDQIGDTQGEFMPSNPPGMRQQRGVDETKPEGLSRVVAGLADLAPGQKFDFDKRGNIDLNLVRTKEDLPKNVVINAMAKLARKSTSGYSLPFDLTIKYAMGDNSPVTTSPGKGFNKDTLKVIASKHTPGTTKGDINKSDYSLSGGYDQGVGQTLKTATVQGAFQTFDYEVTPEGIRVIDRFNFEEPDSYGGNTNIGAFGDIPGAQFIATNLVRIGDLRARLDGKDPRSKDYGPKIDYIIPKNQLTKQQKDLFYGRDSIYELEPGVVKKKKGIKESKLSFELIQQFKEGLNHDRLKKLKEQTTFPQMQERIRNAKEKRREQQKKSEKLYMDTKKKGVKFYDKKGTGRLKDGKKVYD